MNNTPIPSKKFLGQVCKKYTREGISDVFEIEAKSEYRAVRILEELSGIEINGFDN